jgi:hypothetical protein
MKGFGQSAALLGLVLLAGCGDPAGPDAPTPSILAVEFTGDTTGAADGASTLAAQVLVPDGRAGRESLLRPASCQVTANWTVCPDPDFGSYTLYRSTSPGIAGHPEDADILCATNDRTLHTFVDSYLDWETHYYYAVRTADESGSVSWSNEADLTTPGSPPGSPTPSSLTVTFTGDSLADPLCRSTAGWTACPDEDFASYTLYRSESPNIQEHPEQAEVLYFSTSPGQTSYVDEDLEWDSDYYYAVLTANAEDLSSWSNEDWLPTPGSPTPSELYADETWLTVMLSWTQCPDDNFMSYALYRSYSPGIAGDTTAAEKIAVFFDVSVQYYLDSTMALDSTWYALRTTNTLGLVEWSNEESAYPCGSITYAWGWNIYGQTDVPWPSDDFMEIAAGESHSLALDSSGTIWSWGSNMYGQCSVPEPNSGFISFSGGGGHSLGVKADGSMWAWGDNLRGQCDVPEPATGFVAAAAGGEFSLGLKADSSIVGWGYNDHRQCMVPDPATGFVAVAAGDSHGLGLESDGSVLAWGNNGNGQCDVPEPNTGFVAVSAGYAHSLGLKSDGSIVAWGNNLFGQCDVPEPNTGYVVVSAGMWHSMGLRSNGLIEIWGLNDHGQCDVPDPNADFVGIAAGGYHCLGIRAGG